jgi:hypothetical protein
VVDKRVFIGRLTYGMNYEPTLRWKEGNIDWESVANQIEERELQFVE